MDALIVKKELEKMNNALFGSFGEYIFAHYVLKILKKKLLSVHKDSIDFIFESTPVDVGSSRALNKPFTPKKITGKDVFVHFFSDCCSINYPEHFVQKLEWQEIAVLFPLWRKDHLIKTEKAPGRSYTKEYNEIKSGLSSYFAEKGYKARIIYRTVSRGFGLGESPDNLLPKIMDNSSITIYLDFNNFKRTWDNIRFIIAFPDKYSDELPRQEKVTIKSGKANLVKADLIKIMESNHRCFFRDIEELNSEFSNRFFKMS